MHSRTKGEGYILLTKTTIAVLVSLLFAIDCEAIQRQLKVGDLGFKSIINSNDTVYRAGMGSKFRPRGLPSGGFQEIVFLDVKDADGSLIGSVTVGGVTTVYEQAVKGTRYLIKEADHIDINIKTIVEAKLGILTIPIKIHPDDDYSYTLGGNLGAFVGIQLGNSILFGSFGLTKITYSDENSISDVTHTDDGIYLAAGIEATFLNVGSVIGVDKVSSPAGVSYRHDGNLWIAISIGSVLHTE